MKIICTTLIFLLLVCSDLVAQTDSNVVLRNIFLKNNFNAGVSLGVGGVHPQIVMPTAMLKIGRIKLKGIGWGNDRWDSYSDGGFEFGVDALQLPSKSPNNRDYLTAGIGGMRYNSLFQDKQWYQTHSYMLGLARYTHGKRGVWEGKLGVATIEKYGEVEKMGWYKPYTTYERSSRK